MNREQSPVERQVADILRRARKLPVGPHRNDLRQLAVGLLWLHRRGREASLALDAASFRISDPSCDTAPVSPVEKYPAG